MSINRRQFIQLASALGVASLWPGHASAASSPILKPIPKSGERIPVIGMGSSRTFDAMGDSELIQRLQEVMQAFFDLGGGMIDSSPMYGAAQQVLGELLPRVSGSKNLFAATKVWTNGRQAGIDQMERSRQLWGIERFDLMQIHNLVDWRTHLETLNRMKADGKIRYTGITTSHGRFHGQLQDILREHDFDFVQLTYNINNLDVEEPLLSIAQDRGIAVIVNRPFQRGSLFGRVRGKALPEWAAELDCNSWAQFFLKFVVSHPAVTCAIPATSKARHMRDNMQAGFGRLPDAQERQRMLAYFRSL